MAEERGQLFIVGAQRSGSTYLYQLLDSHPEIFMAKPIRPEPKFFLDEAKVIKGREYYEASYFRDVSEEHRLLGEKSTSYIEFQTVAKRIREYYPFAKILMILRNPVDRAFSNYRFSVKHGVEGLSFSEALIAEEGRVQDGSYSCSVNPFAYRQRGHYIHYINNYLEFFPLAQIKVIIFEELVGSLDGIAELYRWLGVDEYFVPSDYKSKVNEGESGAGQEYLASDIRKKLSAVFESDNSRLEELLGREIPAWRHD